MTDPIAAFEAGLYSKLNVSAVTNIATSGIWNMLAPQGTALPYVIYQMQGSGGDTNTNPKREREPVYTVKGVAFDKDVAENISGEIDTLLHEQSITMTGWESYRIQREQDVNYSEQPTGVPIYHVGGVYRFKIQKQP